MYTNSKVIKSVKLTQELFCKYKTIEETLYKLRN